MRETRPKPRLFTAGRVHITGAGEESDLHAATRQRFGFLPESRSFPEFLEQIAHHGARHGWTVIATDLDAAQAALSRALEMSVDEQPEGLAP